MKSKVTVKPYSDAPLDIAIAKATEEMLNAPNEQTPYQDTLAAITALRECIETLPEEDCEIDGEDCEIDDLVIDLDSIHDKIMDRLTKSDEPREFAVNEGGNWYTTTIAESTDKALEFARAGVERANYCDAKGTIWIDVYVKCELTDEEGSDSVQLDEPEPKCTASEHVWFDERVTGGVLITDTCQVCGCVRTIDTWAQRPDTGQEGLHSISYEMPEKYDSRFVHEDD